MNGAWGGTFDELIRVPYADFDLAKLPAGVDPVHLASIGDNLALGWETVMPAVAGITDPKVAVFGGTGSIGLYCVDVAVHCAGARTVYYDDDPVRMKVAEQLGAEAHDIHGKREKDFHLAVDAGCNPERLRKALLSVMPEGYVNSVGIHFDEVQLPAGRVPARSPLPQRQGPRTAEHDTDQGRRPRRHLPRPQRRVPHEREPHPPEGPGAVPDVMPGCP